MRLFALITLGLLFANSFGTAQDFPQFRGPGGDGRVVAKNLPERWDGGGFNDSSWQTDIPGNGWSSPIVIGNRIWLTSAEQLALTAKRKEQKLAANPLFSVYEFQAHANVTMFAIEVDATSGKLLRNIELFTADDPKPIHAQNSYASPTPVSDGERLYCHFGSLGTCCLDQATGKVLWKERLTIDEITGPGGSPVLWNNLVIFACDGADQQFVIALDKLTGQEVWRTKRPPMAGSEDKLRRAFSTPLLTNHDGKEQLISAGAQWVCSYQPSTGKEIWRANFGEGHAVVPRPVFQDGLVYICTGFMKPELWAIQVSGEGDVTDTHVEWTYKKQVPELSSPLVHEQEIYFVSTKGVATCLDAKTGEELWQYRLSGNFSASPLLADGKLYFTNQEGATHVLKPGRSFKELAKNQHFGQTQASLAIANETLLIRTQSQLLGIRRVKQ
jgi:outer membrane protein assembly factor BamB